MNNEILQKLFYVFDSGDPTPSVYSVSKQETNEGTVVSILLKYPSNPEYFQHFVYGEKNCTYAWNHGQGSGSVALPLCLFFSMPIYTQLAQLVLDGRLFGQMQIFENKPVVKLF